MNKWSELLKVNFPMCSTCGQCCKCASPSTAAHNLLQKAAEGNEFARDFFNLFTPYESVDEAKKLFPHTVERSFAASEKSDSQVLPQDVVFYKCRYLSDDNKCTVYEDRSQLCRDYPDSPFLVFAKGCSYEEWSVTCRKKYAELQSQLKDLHQKKKELDLLKRLKQVESKVNALSKCSDESYKFITLFPEIGVVSTKGSWIGLPKNI